MTRSQRAGDGGIPVPLGVVEWAREELCEL
ncbi:hypothetical protein JOD02_000841 [Caldicoprobacter guelmensis]|nr:hypothetical protein [Caldicoprobacter guelmensis]